MKDYLHIYGVGLLIIIAGFLLADQFVKPSPPKQITIATGSESGAYYAYAQEYQKALAKSGIELTIINTKGSIDNIQRLAANEVDIAFVQSGTGQQYLTEQNGDQDLVSLGSVYLEPLWLFMPKGINVSSAAELKGKRIAIGAEGSGTRALTKVLLNNNGITADNATLLDISGDEATKQLLAGRLDALFIVTALEAPIVQTLLADSSINAFDFDRAKAYTRRYSFLSAVELPRGVVDFAQDIPSEDLQLLSAAATLVAHKDIHPALVTLLMQVTESIHSKGGILEAQGQFPSDHFLDFPLDDSAKRYFEYGPPLLQRYLPFWAAVLADQLKVFLIPLIALMIPLMRLLPPVYRWRVRSRIYRWYKDLRVLEDGLITSDDEEQRKELLEKLEELEESVADQSVPLSYSDELYHLRGHIKMVKERIRLK